MAASAHTYDVRGGGAVGYQAGNAGYRRRAGNSAGLAHEAISRAIRFGMGFAADHEAGRPVAAEDHGRAPTSRAA
jgi:hypothetical protein